MIILSRAHFNAAGRPAVSHSLSYSHRRRQRRGLSTIIFKPVRPSLPLSLPLSHLRARFSAILKLSLFCPAKRDSESRRRLRENPSDNFRECAAARIPIFSLLLAILAGPAAFTASLTLTLSEAAAAAAVGRFVSSFLKWAARLGDFTFAARIPSEMLHFPILSPTIPHLIVLKNPDILTRLEVVMGMIF